MLKDRVAFVTGAARGMGKEICMKMAGYGAHIIAVDLDEAGVNSTVEEVKKLGRKAVGYKLNVSDKEQVNSVVEKAVKEMGKIDILCNNAGVVIPTLLVDMTDDIWDKTFAVNVKGPLYLVQAVARVMMKNQYGRIVNTSSMSGTEGEYANGSYCCSKAAITMMSQVLALELAEHNILVNTISPGYTNSELFKNGMADRAKEEKKPAEELIGDMMQTVALKRPAEPEEIAETIAFYASEKNSYTTGANILITGGKVMH